MDSFVYDALAGRVVFGVGRRREIGHEVDRLGLERVLLIADGFDLELAHETQDVLGERCVGLFTKVAQHVPVALAQEVRELATSTSAQGTVTLGGGSATGFGLGAIGFGLTCASGRFGFGKTSVAILHSRSESLWLPVANVWLSGEKATAQTLPSKPSRP